MPKDEFDLDDPMELNGVGLVCEEDTTDEMAECFIEEFARLGYNHKQILALFRNPYYLGMNLALQQRGEEFVRQKISEAFALRGKAITWADSGSSRREEAQTSVSAATTEKMSSATDPMGAPVPDVTL